MRGAVIPTSAHQGIPTTFALRRGIQFHASCYLTASMATEMPLCLIMKKLIGALVLVFVAAYAYPQKDVTKFLGIPVDGSKSAMIQNLKAKGFHADPINKDVLEGKFNGMDVNLHIVTNNDKVCRIMVGDANTVDERSIQIRFNKLCHQFENSHKYISFGNELIPDNEDISYELNVNKKRYEAVFYQKPTELSDTTLLREKVSSMILEKLTPEELANPTEEVQKKAMKMSLNYMMDLCSKKPVWFIISELYGKYYITMYYDNEYNRANGEDL